MAGPAISMALAEPRKQTDTDTGAERHQADVPFAQFTLERAALSGLAVGQMIANWHGYNLILLLDLTFVQHRPRR
jgi:hypothetical protein